MTDTLIERLHALAENCFAVPDDADGKTIKEAAQALAAAEAEAKEIRRRTEWQPIETAPKDGTLLVLYCPDDETKIQAGAWVKEIQEWWEQTDKSTKKLRKEESGYWSCPELPSHWMPLPDAPGAER